MVTLIATGKTNHPEPEDPEVGVRDSKADGGNEDEDVDVKSVKASTRYA